MKSENKQTYHFSIFGVVLFYLLISLSNIFLLPNLSVLNTSNNHFDKQTSFNLVTKGTELGRQFKCVLEERKKAPALSQISLLLSAFIVVGFFVSLFRHNPI